MVFIFDLVTRPDRADDFALSAVFVNRASQSQAFPDISLTLTDAGDLPLACTAKDAARLPAALRGDLWWRDLRVEVPDAPDAWFPCP